MSEVIWIEDEEVLQDVIADYPEVVVDFTAPAWCGPCQAFAPAFDSIAEKYDAVFVAVDVDKAPWAMVKYGVRGVPNVQVFKNGEFVTHVAKTPATRSPLKFLAELNSL